MVSGDLRLTDGKLSSAPKKTSPDLSMKFELPKVVDLSTVDPIKLVEDANAKPKVAEIGSKSVNCIRLKELETNFKVPEFAALPNTLPQSYIQKA